MEKGVVRAPVQRKWSSQVLIKALSGAPGGGGPGHFRLDLKVRDIGLSILGS